MFAVEPRMTRFGCNVVSPFGWSTGSSGLEGLMNPVSQSKGNRHETLYHSSYTGFVQGTKPVELSIRRWPLYGDLCKFIKEKTSTKIDVFSWLALWDYVRTKIKEYIEV